MKRDPVHLNMRQICRRAASTQQSNSSRRGACRRACICRPPAAIPATGAPGVRPGKSRLRRQGIQHIRPDGLFELVRRQVLVGTGADPGFGGVAVAVLLETLQQLRETATEQSADARASGAAEISEQAAEAALLAQAALLGHAACLSARSARIGRSAEHLRKLVPVLIARNGKKAQQGRHGRKSATHLKCSSVPRVNSGTVEEFRLREVARAAACGAGFPAMICCGDRLSSCGKIDRATALEETMTSPSPLILTTDDLHTGGEPVRIVTSGYPAIRGATILDKRSYVAAELDHLRRILMWEPRGHRDMYGRILVEPDHPERRPRRAVHAQRGLQHHVRSRDAGARRAGPSKPARCPSPNR